MWQYDGDLLENNIYINQNVLRNEIFITKLSNIALFAMIAEIIGKTFV